MDKMILNKDDGTGIEVEIVMTFKLEKFNNNDYVIYKHNNEYFGAKYIDKNEETILETNLTNNEKKALNEAFENLTKIGVIQC